ncbi:hypothetical protein P7L78_26550 [Tistrella bauzanensis]|uniref:hypothetical protein n=1 Tax=Tistrella TaxID=171436 RepID=UPI0031F685FB
MTIPTYITILDRAADDLAQVVDDLDQAARQAPEGRRLAIAARSVRAHELATSLRRMASVAPEEGEP